MKKIYRIIFVIFLTFPIITKAQTTIKMPTLQEVMQQNIERYNQNTETKTEKIEETKNITYSTIYTGKSINIKKANETNLYIQEIDLSKGAKIDSIVEGNGFVEETGEPLFVKKSINEVLKLLLREPTGIINGQFFNPTKNPTTLSFALKSNGIIRTAGADNRGELAMIEINGESAKISPYSWKNLESSKGDFALASLTMSSKKYFNDKIGRTYICLQNPDYNNSSSKILTFVAESMNEESIEKEIIKNGCTEKSTLQLDSSGSSRFYFNKNIIYGFSHKQEADKRKIPHYILFYEQ